MLSVRATGSWQRPRALGFTTRRGDTSAAFWRRTTQNLRIGESIRSGARDSVFGYSRSYGIFVEAVAQSPVNESNRVIRY